jgi:hypothetical protein
MSASGPRSARTRAFAESVNREWQAYYVDFMESISNMPGFNWSYITHNLNLSPEYMLAHPEKNWHHYYIQQRVDISIEDLLTRFTHIIGDVDWSVISARTDITTDYIKAHPEYPWDYEVITYNQTLTVDFIKENVHKGWKWNGFQYNKAIDFKAIIREFPDKIHDGELRFRLTAQKILDMDSRTLHVLLHTCDSKNVDICEIVDANIDKPWDWEQISLSANLTLPFIVKYADSLLWSYMTYSVNKQIIFDNPELPWEYEEFTKRNDLTRHEFIEHIMEYTDRYSMSMNPVIKFNDIMCANILKWHFDGIAMNSFEAEKNEFIITKYHKYLSVYRIQQHWIRVKTVPIYALCIKQLETDYASYVTQVLTVNSKPN